MYANQVISDLLVGMKERKKISYALTHNLSNVKMKLGKTNTKKLFSLINPCFDYMSDFFINQIRSCQHFHFSENTESLLTYFKKMIKNDEQPFMGDQAKYINMPFSKCWFDWDTIDNVDVLMEDYEFKTFLKNQKGIQAKDEITSNSGLLVKQLINEDSTILDISSYSTAILSIKPKKLQWHPDHFKAYIKVNDYFTDEERYNFLYDIKFQITRDIELSEAFAYESMIEFSGESNILLIPLIPKLFKDLNGEEIKFLQESRKVIIKLIYIINYVLMILNCKNVKSEENFHFKNIFTTKHGKNKSKQIIDKKMFTYKTLVVELNKAKSKTYDNSEITGRHMRLHLCRGNPAIYTKEKPLFGHYVGRVWRSPSIKGSKKEGLIVKDYLIKKGEQQWEQESFARHAAN